MYRPVNAIEVSIWGKTVGAVALDPKLGYYAFEYAPAFVRSGIELSPLTMPLAQAHVSFVVTDLPELTYYTGEAITINARRILTFKPSVILKESINKGWRILNPTIMEDVYGNRLKNIES